ncbi:DUF1028 domain-containing protein [Burkholderia sp. MR1-5-21]
MTFSIAGRCARTGAVGGIVASSSIAVTSRCLWASRDGVVLSQNVTDPRLGQIGLAELAQGYGAPAVLERLATARAYPEWRQLAVLDATGFSAWRTGERALGLHAGTSGKDCVAVGNLLANCGVPAAMVDAFESLASHALPERLLRALEAGLAAGGEMGPVHSAGLCVFDGASWPVAALRVDWSDAPIAGLRAIWERYAPQMNDYVLRAVDPTRAPSYGVPGDE